MMPRLTRVTTLALLAILSASAAICVGRRAFSQEEKKSEEEFVTDSPTMGESLPDVTVFDSDGKQVKTSSFRGHYTVLTFGCLT
jgi:cytochrome oxidase Cu insertion factor (SCO1/SenC/PrrC family)